MHARRVSFITPPIWRPLHSRAGRKNWLSRRAGPLRGNRRSTVSCSSGLEENETRSRSNVRCPSTRIASGLRVLQHCPLPLAGCLIGEPQSVGLERASHGAYAFAPIVARWVPRNPWLSLVKRACGRRAEVTPATSPRRDRRGVLDRDLRRVRNEKASPLYTSSVKGEHVPR
jgi:hypothetical protein